MKRVAVITDVKRSPIDVVRRYLPSNYTATPHLRVVGYTVEEEILIVGEDVAGWTLDGYVIPRLASGMHYAKEVQP